MKHQDLIVFHRKELPRRSRMVLGSLAFFFIWMAALLYYSSTLSDDLIPVYLFAGTAIALVPLLALAVKYAYGLPKCPHCGNRLYGWLLQIAIASGNCGRCGKSFED